jgi:hypothetical protein
MSDLTLTQPAREARARRLAWRQGYVLRKSRRRNPRSIDYGGWMIVDARFNAVVAGTEGVGRPHWSLDDVERWLHKGSDS